MSLYHPHDKTFRSAMKHIHVATEFFQNYLPANIREPYNKPRDLRKIIEAPPELIEEVLFKDFHLIDTNLIQDEDLKEQLWSGILTFAFKHARDRKFRNAFKEFCKMGKVLLTTQGERALPLINLLLKYQTVVVEWKNLKEMVDIAQTNLINPENGEKIMMTIAEYLRAEGEKVGHRKGESAVLLALLQHKYGVIPIKFRKKLENADANILLIWSKRLLDSDSIEDVFCEERVSA